MTDFQSCSICSQAFAVCWA